MNNNYQQYERVISEIAKQEGLELHGQKEGFEERGYSFCYSKKMPTEDRLNRRSRTLEILISEEFVEDRMSIDRLKTKILDGLKSYQPESLHLQNSTPEVHKIII